MQILGIRTAPASIRYAVLDWDGQDATFTNADGENKLDFPADIRSIEQKLHWLHQELERVLRQYPNIERIVIKSNEFVREKKTTRQSTYMDAVVLLLAKQHNKRVETKLYANIGTNSREVKALSERIAGKSLKYWNTQMADAVAAAWSGREG